MSIFYTSIDAALSSLLEGLTPGQLFTSLVLIIALSFSVAVGICNTINIDDDDEDYSITDCEVDSSCDEDVYPTEEKKSLYEVDNTLSDCNSDRLPYDESKERFCGECGVVYYKPNGRHKCSPEDIEYWKETWKNE